MTKAHLGGAHVGRIPAFKAMEARLRSPTTSLRAFETHWRPRLPCKCCALQRANETPRRKHVSPHVWVSLFVQKDKAPGEEFVAWHGIWYKGRDCIKVTYGPVSLSLVWLRLPWLIGFMGQYVAKADLEFDILLPQYSRPWDISKHYHV